MASTALANLDNLPKPQRQSAKGRTQAASDHLEAILEHVAQGELLNHVTLRYGTDGDTFRSLCATDLRLSRLYARARASQAHAIAEDIMAAAAGDDAYAWVAEHAIALREKDMRDADQLPEYVLRGMLASLDNTLIQRDKLRVDTKKWYVSKLAPKLYGAADVANAGDLTDYQDTESTAPAASPVVYLPIEATDTPASPAPPPSAATQPPVPQRLPPSPTTPPGADS